MAMTLMSLSLMSLINIYTCSSGDEESRNDMDDIDGIIILRLFFISISTQKTLRHLDIFLMVRVSNYMNFT